jgi:hypothetical protein
VHLRWSPTWTYALIPLGLLPYLVARRFTQQRAQVSVFLCAAHDGRRVLREVSVPLLLVGVAIAGSALAAITNHQGFFWISFVAILAMFVFPRKVVFATRMTASHVVLRGASPAFVASLPVWNDRLSIETTDLHPDLF